MLTFLIPCTSGTKRGFLLTRCKVEQCLWSQWSFVPCCLDPAAFVSGSEGGDGGVHGAAAGDGDRGAGEPGRHQGADREGDQGDAELS